MKNKNVLQKTGFILFVIGTVGRYLGKLLGKEINETLKYSLFIAIFGAVIWVIGYLLVEREKKNNKINTDSKKQINS